MNQRTAQVALLGRALHVVSRLHDRHIQILQKRAGTNQNPQIRGCSRTPKTPQARLKLGFG